MPLILKCLGTFEVLDEAGRHLSFPTAKTRALFAFMALQAGKAHQREALAGMFWGDAPEVRARANLRQTLTRVRQALPASDGCCVQTFNGSVRLVGDTIRSDASEFELWTEDGTIQSLEHAASLYQGDLLHGVRVEEEGFDEWLNHERQRYREQAIACFDRLLQHYQATGASTRGIEIANKLLLLDPYRESVHRILMAFYADQERKGAALEQYERCRKLLLDELGLEPEAQTTELYDAIRESSPETRFTRSPSLSRPNSKTDGRNRSSRTVVEFVSRSPWRGANWSKPSVAVLPFDCAGDAAHERYLADGLVEDVITNLARFRDIHVIARNSSFSYRDRNRHHASISAELGVRFLVEGSIRREGHRVRVTVQLIEAETGFHVFADRLDQPLEALPRLRDELSAKIAGVLIGRIQQHELKTPDRHRTESWEAYDCCLRGMDLLRVVKLGNVAPAKALFERALEIDATYARAYCGLALAQFQAWHCLGWSSWWKLHDQALAYAEKALELDREDAQVHAIVGRFRLYTSEFARARHHLERAAELNPHDAAMLANTSIAWSLLGERRRGVEMAEMAIRLDPFHPDWYLAALGTVYFVARDYERAIAAMEVASDGLCDTRAYLAAAYALSGNAERARVHVAEFVRATCERLGGDPASDIPAYCEAMLLSSPYARDEDRDHFFAGLRKAGLPVGTAPRSTGLIGQASERCQGDPRPRIDPPNL